MIFAKKKTTITLEFYGGFMLKGFVEVNIERCKGCELCVTACPPKIKCLSMSKETNKKGYQYVVQNLDTCIGCANCAVVCPDSVLTVYRAKKQSV